MKGIAKMAVDLIQLRVDANIPTKEKPADDIDVVKGQSNFEDDDESDEDFDDADEEVVSRLHSLMRLRTTISSGMTLRWIFAVLWDTSNSFSCDWRPAILSTLRRSWAS